MAALQYADIPGYRALIIRRHVADLTLPNALLDRARGWLRGREDVRWNESKNQWQFASGATLTFGYLAGSRDIDRYASAEFHFIGVDELTQFSEKAYLDLFARLRAPACPACKVEMLSRDHRGRFTSSIGKTAQSISKSNASASRARRLRIWKPHISRCACVRLQIPGTLVMIGSKGDSLSG